ANLGAAAPVGRLAEKLHGPSGEKSEILLALGAIGRPAAPVLRDYLLKGPATDDLRVEALLAFGPQAGREDVAWIAENLKSKNKYIRAAGASALGQIGHPSAQAALMLAVDDAEPIVRATVARAFGQIGTIYAGKQLVLMLDDPSALVRSLAAWGLGQSRYPDAVPALVKMARTTATATEVPLRAGRVYGRPEQAAVETLGKIGTPEAVAAVLEALESPSWLLRATAAQALSDANCRTDDVLAALEKRLDDPVNLVRANALLALRTLGKTFPAGHFQER
ncbi:MAG: HEAT repeat domain-containing protein, partial [Phycisphaerae bacterium]